MDSQYLEQMFLRGGALIIFGMPPKTEFGIDLETWKIGNKFKGIKMIPPGLHFIYFSAVGKYGDTSPRTGFFHWFNEGDVVVKNYDSFQEDLFDEEDSQAVERIKLNLRDLNNNLGPYPFESWTKWISFTQYIDQENLNRLIPKSGKIRSVPELVSIDSIAATDPSTSLQTCEKESASQTQQEEQFSTSPMEAPPIPHKKAVPELVSIDSIAVTDPSTSLQTCEKESASQTQQEEQFSTSPIEATPIPHKKAVPELVSIDSIAATDPSTSLQACEKESASQTQQEEQFSTSPMEATPIPHKKARNFTLDADGLPCMVPLPGTQIQFSEFPQKPHKEGATPSEISKGNMDSSFTLDYIFKQLNKPESLLAELQFCFVCFLGGHVYDGFEHWRHLLAALCNAEETLIQKPSLYLNILSILHHQIQEVPSELFADIVENSNFVVVSLRTLFANIADNITALPDDLILKANKFRSHLTAKFNWNLVLEEDDEDKPVIVEL